MHSAIAAGATGFGVTMASTFASSLGLSLHQQRIGFGVGIFLMLAGAILFVYGRRKSSSYEPDAVEATRDVEATREVFVAAETEFAVASEEALEMARTLGAEWPHITPDGAVIEASLPDWRAKTTDFISVVLGAAQRAAYKRAGIASNTLESLESERDFLLDLARELSVDSIRVNETEFLEARALRRSHQATNLLDYDHSRAPGAPAPPPDLRGAIDSYMRSGVDLVEELSVPVEPEKVNGGWKLESGEAPDEWWKKADDFSSGIRKLLLEQHPALLTDFRDGFNGHLQKEREAERPDPGKDKRSTAKKMLDLANWERGAPARVVEASLEGLAAARHRLGA